MKCARLLWRQPCLACPGWVLRSVEREGDRYLTTTLVINCCGGELVPSYLTQKCKWIIEGILLKEKKWIFFSCIKMATQSGSGRKINGIHELDSDLSEPAGEQWELSANSQCRCSRKRGTPDCAVGMISERGSLTSVFIKCICSVILNAQLRLCHFSPCSFNMMDLFGKSFR